MSLKHKIIAAALALALLPGLGYWLGHYKYPAVNIDPQICFTTVFTPYQSGTDAYVGWLEQRATRGAKVLVADYTLNNPAVVAKLIEVKNRGADLHVLLDLSESKAVSSEAPFIEQLRAAGIEVVIGTSPTKHALMHNKFTVIVNEYGIWVEDGSWNYTAAADKQANMLNMNTCSSPQRGALFQDIWHRLHDFMKKQQDAREAKG